MRLIIKCKDKLRQWVPGDKGKVKDTFTLIRERRSPKVERGESSLGEKVDLLVEKT